MNSLEVRAIQDAKLMVELVNEHKKELVCSHNVHSLLNEWKLKRGLIDTRT